MSDLFFSSAQVAADIVFMHRLDHSFYKGDEWGISAIMAKRSSDREMQPGGILTSPLMTHARSENFVFIGERDSFRARADMQLVKNVAEMSLYCSVTDK